MREEKIIPIIEASVGDRIRGIITPHESGGETYRYVYGTVQAINEDTAIIFTGHKSKDAFIRCGNETKIF